MTTKTKKVTPKKSAAPSGPVTVTAKWVRRVLTVGVVTDETEKRAVRRIKQDPDAGEIVVDEEVTVPVREERQIEFNFLIGGPDPSTLTEAAMLEVAKKEFGKDTVAIHTQDFTNKVEVQLGQ